MNEADIDNVELTEDDMVDPDLLRELKMMGYKETKPVDDDKKSLEDTMNEYKSKALQAKKAGDLENAKSIIKSLKLSEPSLRVASRKEGFSSKVGSFDSREAGLIVVTLKKKFTFFYIKKLLSLAFTFASIVALAFALDEIIS